MRILKLVSVVALGLGVVAASSQTASASARCTEVRAQIIDAGTTTDCDSPNDFCAAGTVHGTDGLNGTTYYTMDGGVAGPRNATNYITATGILVYTTRAGTLTVRETGVTDAPPDASTGSLTAIDDIQSGTGRYRDATGHLFVNGNAANGRFVSNVSGLICRS